MLLVAGEWDVALPPSCAAAYAEMFRDAQLAVAPHGGHSPWLDDPAWFVEAVERFLA